MRKAKSTRNPRLYRIWQGMKQRCYNPNAKSYQWYGGKGIAVCDKWKNCFDAFQTWALSNGYTDSMTIDRIKSDRGYSPDNCQWLTLRENVSKAGRDRMRKRHEEFVHNYPIKSRRFVIGMTLHRLSGLTGIGIDELRLIDNGKIRPGNMTAKNLLAIADALGVDPHILLEW